MAAGCRYDSAGPWLGGTKCTGRLYPGTEALGDALMRQWGGSYGGYSCRPNTADTSQMSVHGTGRALDYFQDSDADGYAIARWLTQNHVKFGIQLVIWQRHDWSCSALDSVPGVGAGDGWTSYGGPNPHTDHLHIELTVPAAAGNTAATYTKELFTVGQYRELRESNARQTRVLKEATVVQGRLTRDYVDARLDALEARDGRGDARQTAAIRQKVENESNEVMAKLDKEFPEPPITDEDGDGVPDHPDDPEV